FQLFGCITDALRNVCQGVGVAHDKQTVAVLHTEISGWNELNFRAANACDGSVELVSKSELIERFAEGRAPSYHHLARLDVACQAHKINLALATQQLAHDRKSRRGT